MKKIGLIIVDEHSVVRHALGVRLSSSPQIDVLAVARDLQEGIDYACSLKPDIILLEPKTADGCDDPQKITTFDHIRRETANGHPSAIIVLTSYIDEDEREAALRAGARRYLLKEIDSDRLIAEIEAVAAELEMECEMSIQGVPRMRQQLVKDWMTRDVITITPKTTLPEAHRLMTEKKIRRLPVMDNGRLMGIITRGDVRGAEPSGATSLSIWEVNYLLSRLKIEELMTRRPVTIDAAATIGEAAQLMLENKISGLPVMDSDQRLVGIITESDIFRLVAGKWRDER
jgi:acetoin utilization protein AcuB